eukprot:gene7335-5169_t
MLRSLCPNGEGRQWIVFVSEKYLLIYCFARLLSMDMVILNRLSACLGSSRLGHRIGRRRNDVKDAFFFGFVFSLIHLRGAQGTKRIDCLYIAFLVIIFFWFSLVVFPSIGRGLSIFFGCWVFFLAHHPAKGKEHLALTPCCTAAALFCCILSFLLSGEHLNRCVIHVTRPIENLPLINTPEMASLGRCVFLTAETSIGSDGVRFVYQGLIAMVTSDCITLLHCTRFTPSDFEAQYNEKAVAEQHLQNDENAFRHMKSDGKGGAFIHGAVSSSFSDVHPLELPTGGSSESDRGKLKEACTFGPVPSITFSRKKIHNVRFAVNPSSTFFSIFSVPEKKLFDLQCLRMFVRRYLVHTSQGNNPDSIPLRAFIICRLNCPHIDNQLLQRVADEELKVLMKEDKKIKSRRKHSQNPHHLASLDMSPSAPAAVQLVGIRYFSIWVGIGEGAVGLFIATFGIFSFLFAMKDPTFSVIKNYWYFFFLFALLAVAAGGFTVYHVVSTPPPIHRFFPMGTVRMGLCLLSLAACMAAGVELSIVLRDKDYDPSWDKQVKRIFIPAIAGFFVLCACLIADLAMLVSLFFCCQEADPDSSVLPSDSRHQEPFPPASNVNTDGQGIGTDNGGSRDEQRPPASTSPITVSGATGKCILQLKHLAISDVVAGSLSFLLFYFWHFYFDAFTAQEITRRPAQVYTPVTTSIDLYTPFFFRFSSTVIQHGDLHGFASETSSVCHPLFHLTLSPLFI